MPPKRVDPETRERDYEAYKQTQQYKKIQEIHDQIRVNLHPFISQTSRDYDLNGKYQKLWDTMFELAVIMKIKPPFKKLQHEWIRSIYFGEKRKADKNEAPYFIDGIQCQFEPVDADAQHHIRQALIKKVTNIVSQKDNFDLENYLKSRSDVKKGIQQLFTLLKSYSKKSFKVIYEEKFMEALKSFSNLLEINLKLVLFQLKYTTPDLKFINNFKKKAITDRYCQCLQKVIQILMVYQNKPIVHKIKPRNVFKKLNYQNLTKIQQFYLGPFSNAFETMKKGLCALFSTGINFWKVPIEENKKFVEDLKVLVNWQLVCQRHLGNPLVRDQINFMSNALSSIDKANDLSRKYMIQKDPNCIQITIPLLVAFRTIQHMRHYRDKEKEIQRKMIEKKKILGIIDTNIGDMSDSKTMGSSPSGKMFKTCDSPQNSKGTFVSGKGKLREGALQEEESLGRYWMWDEYCDQQFKNTVIQQAVQKLKDINKAVQQDIEDMIIREGMLPRKDRHDEERISAADTLKNMKTYHNADKAENLRRPPELWNYPKVIEEQHKFRSIADPKKSYIDGRIEDLNATLKRIGIHLRTHNGRNWNELIRRTIDFFDGTPNSSPAFDD